MTSDSYDDFDDDDDDLPEVVESELETLFHAARAAALIRVSDPTFPPITIDRFETLGAKRGGIGIVFEARDPELDRKVAIKLWSEAGPKAQARLLAEAQTLAKITHPNVVTVYETGRWEEWAYFVMEWVDGMDGHAWMSTQPSWQEVRQVFLAAGEGLAAAHEQGIQHRDFKPANMLIGDDGRVLVADFGLADLLWPSDSADGEPAAQAGTRVYMAPERLRGGQGDARSDLFSFCVAMWEALYGTRPYAGSTPEELLVSIASRRVLKRHSSVPVVIERALSQGLAEDPAKRWSSMRVLLGALRIDPSSEDPLASDDLVGVSVGGSRRLLNAPASTTGQPSSGLLIGAMTLGGVLVGAAMATGIWLERSGGERVVETVQHGELDQPTRPSLASMPCELGEHDPMPVNPVVLEVCELIRRDDFQGANARWLAEYNERMEEGREVGGDTLIVARTFDARARVLQGEPAATTAGYAHYWGGEAFNRLPKSDLRRAEAKRLRDAPGG